MFSKLFFFLLFMTSALKASETKAYYGLAKLTQKPLESYKTINELLAALPEGFRKHYSLVKKSRSIQPASEEFPRVIMGGCGEFNSDCEDFVTLIGFHGNQELSSYKTLEVMQYRKQTKKLELFFVEEKDSSLNFSQINPSRCLSCHGKEPGVIWSPYPSWPGFYRENFHQGGPSLGEAALLTQFFDETMKTNTRYAQLVDRKKLYLSDKNPNYHLAKQTEPGRFLVEGVTVPANTIFLDRFETKLKEIPHLSSYKYALAAAASDCPLESFLPQKIIESHDRNYMSYLQEYIRARGRLSDPHNNFVNNPFAAMPQLLYLADVFRIPFRHWFTDVKILRVYKLQYLFATTNSFIYHKIRNLAIDDETRHLLIDVPNWGGSTWKNPEKVFDCKGIGQLSLKALEKE